MNETPPRPFYSTYAWAFDLLIDRPVRKECATIAAWLVERGVTPGAALLDAGCGTGRFARELARRGYVVHGIDASPEMLDVARLSVSDSTLPVTLEAGDFLEASDRCFDAILCRGVLNDLEEDRDRAAAFIAFARALRPGGVLILDVRDWEASLERKTREPLFRKSVDTEHGRLEFSAMTRVDPERHRLLMTERHTLIGGSEVSADADFTMRCWTREEVDAALAANGFEPASYFGAYDPDIAVGATDRLVLVTRRADR